MDTLTMIGIGHQTEGTPEKEKLKCLISFPTSPLYPLWC